MNPSPLWDLKSNNESFSNINNMYKSDIINIVNYCQVSKNTSLIPIKIKKKNYLNYFFFPKSIK